MEWRRLAPMPYGRRPSFLPGTHLRLVFQPSACWLLSFQCGSCNQEEMCELLIQQRPLDQRLSGLQADNAAM